MVLAALLASLLGATALAAEPEKAADTKGAESANSAMDGSVFLDVLAAEMEAQNGDLGEAFGRMVVTARRTRDEGLFQRAVELAAQARAGDKALAAVKLWRNTLPESSSALRTQLQLLVALDKPGELSEPIRTLIEREPVMDRPGTIASLPRFLNSLADKRRALAITEQALSPYANAAPTRTAVRTALGRMALAADQPEAALSQARRALAEEPSAPGPVLLALELMPKNPAAEALVQGYLARSDALPPVRLAYARALDQQQRIGEAAVQLREVVAKQPDQPAAWLSLGAYMVDLRESDEAIRSLDRFLNLTRNLAPTDKGGEGGQDGEEGDDKHDLQGMIELAYLLQAQAHQQRGDARAAGQWLDKIEPSRVDMPTLTRRASLMAHAGQLAQARALVRDAPARDQPDARTRLLAEAQVLRDQRHWAEAYELLLGGLRQEPEDTTLMYELAMVADRLNRHDDMEALLRRVIALKPDDHHAHNALGYSLADRNIRLEEALGLVQKAAKLAPHDPFIVDSLGWVEYRLGHREEALKLLRRSHLARPHVEVAAHLGELLWVTGQRDEALRIWREGRAREADNDVLQETLTRLQVKL
ncbi:MAG TPA: tetratricopeptide repeat protein [Ideonella sp.]|uniref:tetratricopeptide repeat protein n=1 Tax=Ideonella sp. TaxID=1929293 RepID=UPI002E333227|nr:tetratricopeptide repeat protein [Ideonella sp.]HEX5684996.1 tetratricopeptide repeat protein [Ideonella sp.]